MRMETEFRFWNYKTPDGNSAPDPEPARIYGPVYYVGPLTVCAYLIETSEGLLLVDTGSEKDFRPIAFNIRKLGFRPEEIRWILNTHWHEDHTGGNASFSELSGAAVMIHEGDAEVLETGLFNNRFVTPRCSVARKLKDGDELRFGDITVSVIHSPGQSPGSAVFLADLKGSHGTCKALFAGDATGFKSNPELYALYGYPGAADHYRKSISILKSLEFDLYLGGHPHQVAVEMGDHGNPFISREDWMGLLDARHSRMEEFIGRKETSSQSQSVQTMST